MMDVSKMSDERKSVLLAQAIKADMGISGYLPVESPEFINSSRLVNLYHPANMALAFGFFYWFYNHTELVKKLIDIWSLYNLMGNPPEEIVPILLDELLELAIEAGIVEEE